MLRARYNWALSAAHPDVFSFACTLASGICRLGGRPSPGTSPAATDLFVPAAVPPPTIAAKAYLLVDVLSGQTLAAQNADEPREPASLTKLMSAYLIFRALKDKELVPSQMVNVSAKAWRAEGSRMFIEPKKAVSVDELLHGMIVQSGNDASIALAETMRARRKPLSSA